MRWVPRLVTVFAVVVLAAGVLLVVLLRRQIAGPPECEFALPPESGSTGSFTLTTEQTGNAATIAAVALKRGLDAHAVTIALATVMQESKLRNLAGGDRDSVGLFQQRPSQGWGRPDQVGDPVYAATIFYDRLVKVPGWDALPVTVAAQEVQRSAAPDAYAQWEPKARVAAAALRGEFPAAMTCRNVKVGAPQVDLVAAAVAEFGSARLSGPQPAERGWTIATWLVAHAVEFGVDKVSFAGRTWTASSGSWDADATAGPDLSLRQVPVTQKPD